jgi:hypothetical protein
LKIRPEAVASKADEIAANLRSDGFHPQDQPQTFAALTDLRNMEGKTVSAGDVDRIRKRLNRIGGNFNNPPEQEGARRSISAIDEWLGGGLRNEDIVAGDLGQASRVLNEARANYAAGSRLDQLRGATYRADLQAAGAHSGQNINNAMRQQIRSILLSDRKKRGFSPTEIAAMEKVVKGTATANVLRQVAKLLPNAGIGGLGNMLAGYSVTGSPIGALAGPAVGAAMRKMGNASTARGIADVERLIALRSPIGANATAAPPNPVARLLRQRDPERINRRATLTAQALLPSIIRAQNEGRDRP